MDRLSVGAKPCPGSPSKQAPRSAVATIPNLWETRVARFEWTGYLVAMRICQVTTTPDFSGAVALS